MKDFLKIFPFRKFSIFLTIVGSFTYNILLDKDLTCNCEHKTRDCVCYMILPWAIIFFLMLWTDKPFQRAWSYTCSWKWSKAKEGQGTETNRCVFLGVILSSILKALLIGLLWVISLCMDGDWYVCWKSELACKDQTKLTPEDLKGIVDLKNTSRFIGFGVLLSILFLTALFSSIDWLNCCCCDCCSSWGRWCSTCDKREVAYYQLILKEKENVMEDVLKEAATDKLKEIFIEKILYNKNPKEYFKAADEIIENCGKPELSREQQKLRNERMGKNRKVKQQLEEQHPEEEQLEEQQLEEQRPLQPQQ